MPEKVTTMSRIFALSVLSTLGRRCLQSTILLLALSTTAFAAPQVTTLHKDAKGWQIRVDGEPFYAKGMVWSYTPRGENYTYDLWGQDDEMVKKILDYDWQLMQAAGINFVRSFNMIPPRWVEYLYDTYGMYYVVNHLAARYGNSYRGTWEPNTNYQDPFIRQKMIEDVTRTVEMYKDTRGVIMFAIGNEANYGLSWSSFEIQDFPEGEQHKEKAKFLYSVYNEIIKESKKITTRFPYTIVNGDLQYMDLIKEYLTDMDLLGTNVYRGRTMTSLWRDASDKLDLPVILFEFGSDAFNVVTNQEDQLSQALIIKDQWEDMFNNAYGHGVGNSVGGTLFEWRDEWWKYRQTENLDVQDNNASWSNGGYPFDFVEGQNNMNEEWWGVARLGIPNSDGVYAADLRMAYDVLKEAFKVDPFAPKKKAAKSGSTGSLSAVPAEDYEQLKLDMLQLKSEVRILKADARERSQIVDFTGGRLEGEWVLKGSENAIDLNGEEGIAFTNGEMLWLDFDFNPTDKITGQFSLNVLSNVADKDDFEITYGRRGLPVDILVPSPTDNNQVPILTDTDPGRERVEIYDFEAKYTSKEYDFTTFYHVPRYHWKYKGDFYGLLREATDTSSEGSTNNMDIWNAKAPFGAEFIGKDVLGGLTVLFGPEVYWGANPLVMVKYDFKAAGNDITLMHSEDVARLDDSSSLSEPTGRQSRFTTAYVGRDNFLLDGLDIQWGGIMARSERIGDEYYFTNDGIDVRREEIKFEDTLGTKVRLDYGNAYLKLNYSGLVADGGEPLKELGHESTHLPLSEAGNRKDIEAGILLNLGGDMTLFPRVLIRDNLLPANPAIDTDIAAGNPGLGPRNDEDDPFAVTGYRKARSEEVFFTYDPTGETFFYDWDNDSRENAPFAMNFGANYTEYPTPTDSYLFFFADGGFNAPFGVGLPPEDIWTISSRMIFNDDTTKYILRFNRGLGQSTGDPTGGSRKYWSIGGDINWNKQHWFNWHYAKDHWGPYDFYRQFNITYPTQLNLDYSYVLDQKKDPNNSSQVGVRFKYRSLDENSPDGEYQDGANDYDFLAIFYFKWAI